MADEVERTKSSEGNRIVGDSKRERGLRRRFPTERSKSKRKKDRRYGSTSVEWLRRCNNMLFEIELWSRAWLALFVDWSLLHQRNKELLIVEMHVKETWWSVLPYIRYRTLGRRQRHFAQVLFHQFYTPICDELVNIMHQACIVPR